MPRGRPPKPVDPPAVDPNAIPADIAAAEEDTGDPDPALEDERADGGQDRSSSRSPFGPMGPMGDPFEKLRQQMGMDKGEQPEVEIPQPGSSQAITEEALARRGTTEYPDDMLVTVKLWEVNEAGVAGDPITIAHNVLYSTAKEPMTWIEYGGKWYMELVQPETKKKLVRKTFVTRGDPAPKNWRPRIGGEEMDEQKFANAMVMALRGTGIIPNQQPQQMGLPPGTVPQGVYGDVPGSLRADITELKGKIERLEKERDDAKDTRNEMARQRDLAQQEVKGLEREVREVRERCTSLQTKVDNAPKSEKPEWAYAAEVFGKRGDDGIKTADLLKLQEKFTDALSVLKGGGGQSEAISQLNTAMDLMEKMRKAAGLPTAGVSGGSGEGDTLNKILGLADKAASLVQGRQRLVEIERGGHPPAQQQGSSQTQGAPQQRTEQDMDKEALERTLHRLEVAFHKDRKSVV